MRGAVWLVALLCGSVQSEAAWAQDVSPASVQTEAPHGQPPAGTLRFSFAPRAPGMPSWEIGVQPDRSGWYRELSAGTEEQEIHVSESVWKRLAAGASAVRSGHCETRQKDVARTGVKTFSVTTEAAPASCAFNYSDDETLNDAGSAFLALAQTMQEGAKLQRDLRFDRLALDADMDLLVGEVAGGQAVEPANIAPVLQAIAADDRVIDRVRRKAARLLQTAAPAADKPR